MAQTLVIEGLKKRSVPINLRQSGNSEARMLISTPHPQVAVVAHVQGRGLPRVHGL